MEKRRWERGGAYRWKNGGKGGDGRGGDKRGKQRWEAEAEVGERGGGEGEKRR